MATFYIDPSSATNGVGSEVDPFNSWGSVTWTAGNTYLQKAGTTHNGTITVGTSGTSGNRITIGAYGSGARPIVQGLAAEHGINLGTRSYIDVIGMHAIGGSNSTRNGINGLATDALTAEFINIIDCIVESPIAVDGNGIQLRGAGNVIRGTEVRNCVQDGMFLTVSNCLIDDCYIHDFDIERTDGDGIQFAGTHAHGTVVVRKTRIIGHTNAPQKQCIITAAGTGTFRVEGGEFFGMVTGLSIAIANAVIEGAKIHGGTQRGVTCAANGITVRSCLIHDTPRGISLDTVTGVVADNNTIDASEEGITASTGAATYTARNCWIDAPTVHTLSATASATLSTNRYPSGSAFKINATTYDLAGWKTASSTDADAAEVAPLLTTGYRPQAGSPLIGAGAHLGYLRDISGVQRQNPPSIGAFDAAKVRTRA